MLEYEKGSDVYDLSIAVSNKLFESSKEKSSPPKQPIVEAIENKTTCLDEYHKKRYQFTFSINNTNPAAITVHFKIETGYYEDCLYTQKDKFHKTAVQEKIINIESQETEELSFDFILNDFCNSTGKITYDLNWSN
ncbi:MAG: hypothetical protein C0592_14550 [Marinilabiliales bacterium]|nr:MAG: hypothetical protein C0592_14550 [Marinilabiliales bacterium]